MRKTIVFGASVLLVAFAVFAQASAPQPVKDTVITIEDLDCPVCAKNIEKAVAAVPGVNTVKTDVDKQIATVTPDAKKAPSAKSLWEAVEQAGFKPTKLEGPSGTFTKKPGR